MTDFMGKEISVGDRVVFAVSSYLSEGEIITVNDDFVVLKWDGNKFMLIEDNAKLAVVESVVKYPKFTEDYR